MWKLYNMRTVLAIDTATENCSVALSHQGQIYLKSEVAPQKHANLVLAMIDGVLTEAGIDRGDIELIGFGSGPGSFTGVRIAVSAAQALALGLDLKVFGVSDLKLLAAPMLWGEAVPAAAEGSCSSGCSGSASVELAFTCLDARMGEVYYALYRKQDDEVTALITEKVGRPEVAVAEFNEQLAALGLSADSAQICYAGTGIPLLEPHGLILSAERKGSLTRYPRADAILLCAAHEEPAPVDPAEAEPLYCRNEVTWKKIGEQ